MTSNPGNLGNELCSRRMFTSALISQSVQFISDCYDNQFMVRMPGELEIKLLFSSSRAHVSLCKIPNEQLAIQNRKRWHSSNPKRLKSPNSDYACVQGVRSTFLCKNVKRNLELRDEKSRMECKKMYFRRVAFLGRVKITIFGLSFLHAIVECIDFRSKI